MAERRAIASGFWLSEMGTAAGSGSKVGSGRGVLGKLVCGGGGGICVVGEGEAAGGSMELGISAIPSWLFGTEVVCERTGVTGEYGGRGGVPGRSLWSCDGSMTYAAYDVKE